MLTVRKKTGRIAANNQELNTLVNILKAESPRPRFQLIVRQVNEQTTPSPTQSSGISELDLTLKTI
jgi:hypothetical protein